MKGQSAVDLLMKNPLNLTASEVQAIQDAVQSKVIKQFDTEYDSKKDQKAPEFEELNRAIRTALFSQYF